ncbi:MAG: T9SS type A sorting domain-containing protein [Cryomorphaceae bacterium]|jgi:hypothetical protein|nr:T9SS type A sorting domain-containing protein [Cryomorphaceae bacterium]
MKKVLLIIGLGLSVSMQAQSYLHQVLILNEGYYDYNSATIVTPVTVGSYNPSTQTYQEVSTISNMRFASDLVIEGNAYYVAADSKILKYDLNGHNLIAEVNCPGVRNLAVSQGKLIATRGEYLTTYDSYVHVYDATSLLLIQAIDTVNGPKWATQNIVINGDKAYIAVNNGYEWGNEKGIVGALDLNTLSYGNEIDLGPDGKNPDNLIIYNGKLYTVNNKDWSGSSVSEISLASGVANTVNLANAGTGCGTSALRDDQLVYQISMETTLNAFDISVMNVAGPIAGHQVNYYELAQEPVSGNFYCSETDFFSYGTVHIFDGTNTELNQFSVSTSPGTVVFDVRPSVGITEMSKELTVYPNPANTSVNVNVAGEKLVYSLEGTLLMQTTENMLDLSALSQGMYVISVNGQQTTLVKN